jgi:hypothetical protein
MRLPLILASLLLAAACSRQPATDTARSAPAPRDSVVAASIGFGGFGGFGAVRGQLVPEGVDAVITVTAEDGGQAVIDATFSDPLSGEFAAEELPADVYRIEVQPLDPAYSPRVIEGVVVPVDEVQDLGTIDLRRDGVDGATRK